MKILIIDRDDVASELIKNKLISLGHDVVCTASKNDGATTLAQGHFDAVFIDPAPLTDTKQIVLNVKKAARKNPYVLVMSSEIDLATALRSSANDFLEKPASAEEIKTKADNIERLLELINKIGNTAEDFPSSGGVISKSAFNQLFLSSIERADRYGESTHLLFIGIKDPRQIIKEGGAFGLDHSVAKLAHYLVKNRRQSDIIAQTEKYEFALLLQRPSHANEVLEAANRFADILSQSRDIMSIGMPDMSLYVSLIRLPTGSLETEHVFPARQEFDIPVEPLKETETP